MILRVCVCMVHGVGTVACLSVEELRQTRTRFGLLLLDDLQPLVDGRLPHEFEVDARIDAPLHASHPLSHAHSCWLWLAGVVRCLTRNERLRRHACGAA